MSVNIAIVSDSTGDGRWALWTSAGVTTVAIAAVVTHLVWPDPKIDFVTVTLLGYCLPSLVAWHRKQR